MSVLVIYKLFFQNKAFFIVDALENGFRLFRQAGPGYVKALFNAL
jgi:hypothetical protein